MAKRGRPRKLTEDMSTIRVRVSQRQMLSAMRTSRTEPLHQVLSKVLKEYLKTRPVLRNLLKRRIEDAR